MFTNYVLVSRFKRHITILLRTIATQLVADASRASDCYQMFCKSDYWLTVPNYMFILLLLLILFRSYIDTLVEEINDRLQENGTVTIAELAKTYDLPGDFIKQVLSMLIF